MNPFQPPKTPVERLDLEAALSRDPRKVALRPLGLVIVVILFAVFSVIDSWLLWRQGDYWWLVVLVVSAALIYLFRGLWWGDNSLRKQAILLGAVLGTLSLVFPPDETSSGWSLDEIENLAEGIYMLAAAIYFAALRNHSFFAQTNAA